MKYKIGRESLARVPGAVLCPAILLLSIQSSSECAPIHLTKGQFVDNSCHVFRKTQENGFLFVVKEVNGKVVAREQIDCDEATLDHDGTREFHLKIAHATVYCHTTIEDKYAKDKIVH